jgi:hypothetical protein
MQASLERRLTEQHDREERIASDLQRLSARLVHAREESSSGSPASCTTKWDRR